MGLPILVATPALPTQFTVTVGVVPQPAIIVTVTTLPHPTRLIKGFPIFSGPLAFTISGVDTFGNTITGAFPGIIMPTTIKVFCMSLPVVRQGDFVTLVGVPTLNASGSPVPMTYTVTVTNAGQLSVLAG